MRKDHKTDIAMFDRESTSGKDPHVKSFADGTLPTLENHLKQSEGVSNSSRREDQHFLEGERMTDKAETQDRKNSSGSTKTGESENVSDHAQQGGQEQRQKYQGGLPDQGQKAEKD